MKNNRDLCATLPDISVLFWITADLASVRLILCSNVYLQKTGLKPAIQSMVVYQICVHLNTFEIKVFSHNNSLILTTKYSDMFRGLIFMSVCGLVTIK